MNALNSYKLEVPAWILKVEGDLKAEWERENAKMKKGARGWKAGVGDFRKTSGDGPGTSHGVNLSGMSLSGLGGLVLTQCHI